MVFTFIDILLDIVHTLHFLRVTVKFITNKIYCTISFLVSDHSLFSKLVI